MKKEEVKHTLIELVGAKIVEVNQGMWIDPFVDSIILEKNKKRYVIRRADVSGFPPEKQIAIFEEEESGQTLS